MANPETAVILRIRLNPPKPENPENPWPLPHVRRPFPSTFGAKIFKIIIIIMIIIIIIIIIMIMIIIIKIIMKIIKIENRSKFN